MLKSPTSEEFLGFAVATVDTLRFSKWQPFKSPRRSARILALRLGLSRPTIAKYIRRKLVLPDYESDSASFFDPARLPQLKQAIAANRQRNWRHIGATARRYMSAAA
jgi:hypothetical protein